MCCTEREREFIFPCILVNSDLIKNVTKSVNANKFWFSLSWCLIIDVNSFLACYTAWKWAVLPTLWAYALPPFSRLKCVRWVKISLCVYVTYRILFSKENGKGRRMRIGAMLELVRTVDQENRVAWEVMEINLHNSIEKVSTYQEDHSYNQVAEKIPCSSHKSCSRSTNNYNSIATLLQGQTPTYPLPPSRLIFLLR